MGDSKEIRISVDITTRQNQLLWAELSRFKPRERNKLIIDALVQYFIYNPHNQKAIEVNNTDTSITSNDSDIRLMLSEVMKRLERLERGTSGDAVLVETAKHHKEEGKFAVQQVVDKVEETNSTQSALEQEKVETENMDVDDSHVEDVTGIPDEVMAMLMSMQAE